MTITRSYPERLSRTIKRPTRPPITTVEWCRKCRLRKPSLHGVPIRKPRGFSRTTRHTGPHVVRMLGWSCWRILRGGNKTGLGDLRSAVSAGSETRAELGLTPSEQIPDHCDTSRMLVWRHRAAQAKVWHPARHARLPKKQFATHVARRCPINGCSCRLGCTQSESPGCLPSLYRR